jgi:hypothetical protein
MNNRCRHDKQYAGRGIKVCEEWSNYENFAKWARENGFREDLSIERIDVNGDYCPDNCKWIPIEKQARNRTTTKWVEFEGKRMSLAEAAEIVGLPYKQVHFRLKHGWSLEEALYVPLQKGRSDLRKKCDKLGMKYSVVCNRIYTYGWTEEEALSIPIAGKGANGLTYKRPEFMQKFQG